MPEEYFSLELDNIIKLNKHTPKTVNDLKNGIYINRYFIKLYYYIVSRIIKNLEKRSQFTENIYLGEEDEEKR